MTPKQFQELLIIVLIFLPSLLVSCPSNAVNSVFRCLANLTIGLHDENVKAGEDVDIVRHHCESGEFESSARCVEVLFHKCRQSQQISLLYKLVDPDKIRLSFDKICGKLDLYSKSKACIMRQDSKIKRCFHEVEYVFHDNIAKARYVDHVILTYCGFQLGLRDCIVQPVTTSCGKDIGRFMNDFMDGVTAPVCMKDIYGNSALCTIPELTFLFLMTLFILTPFL